VAERVLTPPGPLSVTQVLAPHLRGSGDPTMRLARGEVWRATQTIDGPATLRVTAEAGRIRVQAWGDGSERVLDEAPALLGFLDRPEEFQPPSQLLRQLRLRFPGVRLGRSGRVMEALVPAIFEQKVTGTEAWRAWRALVRQYGEPAPGPPELRLRLPPTAERIAAIPSWAFHPLGVERRRAETVLRATRLAARLERLVDVPPEDAYQVLRSIPGVGPWTAAEVGLRAFGDPDAVSVGDFHLPHLVSWALAREPRATDERMLELLAPYEGQRGRVIRLLEASGIRAPRYGPRLSPRSIAAI
jgi:3-methyladenine DNA glycosylase/8-oxoguanine DNA glycosylase